MKLAAAVSAAVVLVAPAAFACVNGMKLELFERKENLVAKSMRAHREGHYTEAVSLAERGLAAQPSEVDRRALLRTHGLANLKLGRFDKSIESFEAVVKEKKDPFVQAKLAESHLRRGEAQGELATDAKDVAEKLFADGLLSDPDALTALARARVRAGDVEGAKAACDEVLRLQPGHPEAVELRRALTEPRPPPKPSTGTARPSRS